MFCINAVRSFCVLFLISTGAHAAGMDMKAMPAPSGTPANTVIIKSFMFAPGLLTIHKYSFKFDKPGTYKFLCSIHPQMRARSS